MRALVTAFGALACSRASAPKPFAASAPVYAANTRIVIVGDLQRTSFLEFWRESNDAERAVIVRAIADAHPALVAMTGDCVFDGGSDSQWSDFDALVAPIRDAGIPAIAAFGNHEYWSGREEAEARVFARFPRLAKRHWYTVAWGPLRLVVVDSNVDELTDEERETQRDWYGLELRAFDADDDVRGVLVLHHHPPFTNSTVTSDEPDVQRDFLPAFLAARKTLAMITGHVHSYERFARAGKMLVVSGGGGGPRARLATGASRRHADDLFAGPALRDFNFVVVTADATRTSFEVRGIPKGARDASAAYVMDRFDVPFAAIAP